VTKLKADMKDPAIDKQIAATMALAKKARIEGTPELIVDGTSYNGEVDDEQLKTMRRS
jgi:protein-disulfide isomerase